MLLPLAHVLTVEVLNLVKVRCYLHQPLRLDLNHIPHILLRGQHQLMIDHTLRLILHQHGTRMYPHIQMKLTRLVVILIFLGAIHEKPSNDAFADVGVLVVFINAKLLVVYIDLDSLH